MKNKQDFTIKQLCELTLKILEVEIHGKDAVKILSKEKRKAKYESLSEEAIKEDKEKQKNERGFSDSEIGLISEHKEFFKQNFSNKICALIGI